MVVGLSPKDATVGTSSGKDPSSPLCWLNLEQELGLMIFLCTLLKKCLYLSYSVAGDDHRTL